MQTATTTKTTSLAFNNFMLTNAMRSRRRRQVALTMVRMGRMGREGAGIFDLRSPISDRGNWIIYGNINTYRAFTEDWAAPISSMDFLQEDVSRLVKARGGGFGGWKTGLKREEFATGFSCASLLFCALCFCQFVICVVQLIAEINLSNATLPHCSIVAAECCYLCVFQLIDSLETDWGTNWDSRPLLGYC